MFKFSLKILLLLLLLVIGYVILTVVAFDPGTPKYVYLAATTLKHNRLTKAPSPRMILVGGSGVNLGFDGPRIEQATKMSVVNMGLQAGLGLRFELNEIRDELRPGDSVVIVSEYEHYYTLVDGNSIVLSTLYYYPAALRYITTPSQVLVLANSWMDVSQEMVKGRLSALVGPSNGKSSPLTVKRGYDAQGDYIGHLKMTPPGIAIFGLVVGPTIDPQAIQVLNDFDRMATSKGVKVYLLFPAIPQELYQSNLAQIQLLCNTLAAQTSIPILDSPADYAFPRDYFFDTVYHLNVQGRAVRTDKFIAAWQAQVSGHPLTPCNS